MLGSAEPRLYEAYPGAASAALPAQAYRQRQPQRTALHRLVRDNLCTFLAEGEARSEHGVGYPYYVEKEFRDTLLCGDATRGFSRLRCGQCGHEVFLPPSCKNRGICPSCTARRMSDQAAYLVDLVLPQATCRQWTVTFPRTVRFLMARDHHLITAIFGIALRLIFAWQRRQAKRAGHPHAKPAAVGLMERFGGALNCNVHGHLLLPDGVFVQGEAQGDTLRFLPLAPPETPDLERLVLRLAQRTTTLWQRRLGTLELAESTDSREGAISEAMNQPSEPWLLPPDDEPEVPRTAPRCASVDGFSIHANTAVPADSRPGLEKLCRYGMRPPFSQERLSISEDGKVQLKLQRPWPTKDGLCVLSFDPLTFLRRLSPLIPPPYAHRIRYWGLFAPHAKGRDLLPAAPVSGQGIRPSAALCAGDRPGERKPVDDPSTALQPRTSHSPVDHADHPAPGHCPAAADHPSFAPASNPGNRPGDTSCARVAPDGQTEQTGTSPRWARRQVLPWHQLLRRVFALDVLVCPQCLGPITVIAYISDPTVALKILAHLGLPTTSPPLAPARLPAQADFFEDDGALEVGPQATPTRAARGPPRGDEQERWVHLDPSDDFDQPIDPNNWGA